MAEFHIVFTSGELEVRTALGELCNRLRAERRGVDLDESDLGAVELVVGEILNNIVEHAYGPDGQGQIRLTCDVIRTDPPTMGTTRPDPDEGGRKAGYLALRVCDYGRALPGLSIPPGTPADLECDRDDLPEGGFGWFLVRTLTRKLTYQRRDGCNDLRFEIPVPVENGMG